MKKEVAKAERYKERNLAPLSQRERDALRTKEERSAAFKQRHERREAIVAFDHVGSMRQKDSRGRIFVDFVS